MRSIVLNALTMSTRKQTQSPLGPRDSKHACIVIPASSHAPCPLNPSWVGRSVASDLRVSSERIIRFPNSRLRVSPTAMGRTPSPFFLRGMRRLAHNQAAIWSWMWHDSHWRARRSRAMRRRCTAPCSPVRRASWRCCGRSSGRSCSRCWGKVLNHSFKCPEPVSAAFQVMPLVLRCRDV